MAFVLMEEKEIEGIQGRGEKEATQRREMSTMEEYGERMGT